MMDWTFSRNYDHGAGSPMLTVRHTSALCCAACGNDDGVRYRQRGLPARRGEFLCRACSAWLRRAITEATQWAITEAGRRVLAKAVAR